MPAKSSKKYRDKKDRFDRAMNGDANALIELGKQRLEQSGD
ncbi:MAG: hypothetical protein ACRERV_00495 [Methylococcales bacterium]